MYPTTKLKKRTNKKLIFLLFGLGLNIAGVIALYVIFLFAFFNDNQILLYVNSINERWFEFLLIPIVIGIGVFIFVQIIRHYNKLKCCLKSRFKQHFFKLFSKLFIFLVIENNN